ncbi:hypothetical protein Q8G39_28675, partial [Klebsiella pneumoniae]|uniref:hypothetical protein n=1 Tax=Klebsiella pneumoniae TaxID=573 RepID=UPI003013CD5D
ELDQRALIEKPTGRPLGVGRGNQHWYRPRSAAAKRRRIGTRCPVKGQGVAAARISSAAAPPRRIPQRRKLI